MPAKQFKRNFAALRSLLPAVQILTCLIALFYFNDCAGAQKTAQDANRKSAEYFENWDKQTSAIKFEAVRDESVSRKTLVSNEFNTVNQRYRENQAVIEPLISCLQDIRTALDTDPTLEGVQSMKALTDNAERNTWKVQGALVRLTDDLSTSGARMSSVSSPEIRPKSGVGEATHSTQDRAQTSP